MICNPDEIADPLAVRYVEVSSTGDIVSFFSQKKLSLTGSELQN